MEKIINMVELFGGIGSPRAALRNIGIPVKSIDYVEIDEKAVRSYNAIFKEKYTPKSIVGCKYDSNIKIDVLIHGSPCQDFSIAGYQKGADEGSGTRSSLMWETLNIIESMGELKPSFVIWENVTNVKNKNMIHNFNKYMSKMHDLGYTNSFDALDAREFGLPQKRRRIFTISTLDSKPFDFKDLINTPMRDIKEFLEDVYGQEYIVTQPSMLKKIVRCSSNFNGIVPVIDKYAMTITCKQMRCPNSGVIDIGNGKYRYLTERECWRLQGYSDEDFDNALSVNPGKPGKMNGTLYKQAGNSIAVPILESIFRKIFLGETSNNTQKINGYIS